jgi:glycosyltransferase involved in cell wall biosynthesis
MNILVLNFEYPPLGGGASPVCHEINRRYVAAGHHVTVVTMHYKDLPREENIEGVEIIRIPCIRTRLHICSPIEQFTYIYQAKRFLQTWLRTHSYDIVHAHFILPTGLLCTYLRNKYNLPYIITAHGSDIPGFNPDRFVFLHHFTPPMIRRIIRHAAAITSPSGYLKDLIEKSVPTPGSRIIVIPNGIDSESFVMGQKEKIIVSSGRLLARKGFIQLVEAAKALSSDYTVHILGDGPLRAQLENTSRGSLTPVVFHGWVDNRSPEYRQLLSACAVYCLVSAKENASIAILEAMASGCAVITSDQSGCPEMISDTGMLVPFGHSEKLRAALQHLIHDQATTTMLGQQARQRACTVYDWNVIVRSYLELLEETKRQQEA